MEAADVHAALKIAVAHLPADDWADWDQRVPGLKVTARRLLAHLCDTPIWYSIDLSGGAEDLGTVKVEINPESDVARLRRTLVAGTGMLARVLLAASPDARGYHPWGVADPDGFAAMACDELLVHTDDLMRAAGREFTPPADLANRVLRRLFPWAPDNGAPWLTLLWANGRTPLGHRGQLDGWRWHSAPLASWDGVDPTRGWERDPA